ncbi:uncharacterized protein DUF4388 [Geothermobacter ehrlichii]|uniref:Uncharacterized protein DUF4388 n=1 Tax=Geothermobacter ehrlichii TaxID=213224 RepID=A0A5D3WME3_9BACT|nr:DUF4388 domain-containing protein [Geothermobacter ehrlichii]TYP00163.1 uncharacterized protein DUF4388 [Geothermobacter ehrlichii]
MKHILLVDDEKPFLLSLKDGLLATGKGYRLFLAGNGREALQILSGEKIDLLVTDLKLPVMDGFQLLAHVSRSYPTLPVIVMTAFGTPEIEERLSSHSSLHYLEKPLDIDLLAETIDRALTATGRSYIKGISLSTFLQLIHMEKKTCTLKVHSRGRAGYLYLRGGELIDADTKDRSGEQAALQIVAWDEAEIEMDDICRRQQKRVDASLEFILMEAFRLKDEAARNAAETGGETPESPTQDASNETRRLDALTRALQEHPGIREYAVFDGHNFLERHSSPPCSITHLDPSYYLSICSEMKNLFACGNLRYMLIQGDGGKTILFAHPPYRVATSLQPGAKPARVFAELKSTLAHEA